MKTILFGVLALTLIITIPIASANNSTTPYQMNEVTDIWTDVPILVGALLAGVAGFSVNIFYGLYKDRKDKKKLRNILSREFGIVYRALESMSDIQKTTLKNAQNEQEAIESGIVDQHEALTGFQLVRVDSPLWNAVMSNDILFKLNENEITAVHHAIHNIEVCDANTTYLIEKAKKDLNPPSNQLFLDNSTISDYLLESINNCLRTMRAIEELDELGWFYSKKLPEYKEEVIRYANMKI